MKRILNEPLAHFLLIGALMFAVYGVVSNRGRAAGTIVVGPDQIDMMTAVFERTWGHAPTPADIKGLIEDYVREDVYYREGVGLGLDRNDPLIRRRMRQKVEFLAESISGIPEPSERALETYLAAHRDRFVSPARFTFRQVYLGTSADATTASLLAQLNRIGDADAAADLGRATQLDARMALAPSPDIERTFGRSFTEALAATPLNTWRGPLKSDYGLHLVLVSERVDARAPALDEVRDRVKRDWQRDELAAATEKYYASLRARYVVRIDDPRIGTP